MYCKPIPPLHGTRLLFGPTYLWKMQKNGNIPITAPMQNSNPDLQMKYKKCIIKKMYRGYSCTAQVTVMPT